MQVQYIYSVSKSTSTSDASLEPALPIVCSESRSTSPIIIPLTEATTSPMAYVTAVAATSPDRIHTTNMATSPQAIFMINRFTSPIAELEWNRQVCTRTSSTSPIADRFPFIPTTSTSTSPIANVIASIPTTTSSTSPIASLSPPIVSVDRKDSATNTDAPALESLRVESEISVAPTSSQPLEQRSPATETELQADCAQATPPASYLRSGSPRPVYGKFNSL